MLLATWNVNSIRARADRVVGWLERADVDVLAMQETKCRDDQFPYLAFEAAGYEVAHAGKNQWNGVAVASRIGIDDVEVGFAGQPAWGDPPVREARALGATCGGVRLWSLYVPNGRELADPHYVYKLAWLDALRAAAGGWLAANPAVQIALAWDWNIAPRYEDVWDMAEFVGSTHVSEPERAAFAAFVEAGYVDPVRERVPGMFTYWDYKQLSFPKGKGMRIDFALTSPALAERVVDARIERNERKGKAPSDHVPVVLEIADA